MKHFQHEKALVSPEATVGEKTRVWAFANIQPGAVVGRNCNICDCCYIETGVTVGNNVTVKNGVSIFNGVTIEDDVFIGVNVVFINDRNPRSNRKDAWSLEKTLVKKGATLGSNATIMCGVTIGEYAMVGAGSVVMKDVAPYTIVFGNPSKFKCYVCQCGKALKSTLKCSCGLSYTKAKQGLKLNA